MQVCSNFKRFRASLQELLGIKRRNRVKGQDISAPYNFKKETTVIPGITEEYLESLRDEALASQHFPTGTRSRRGVDRNKHTNKTNNLKTKSHTQLRTSSSLANFTAVESTSSTSANRKQLGTSKSCLSLNALQSHGQHEGLQPPPRKFSVPSSASSPSVSHGLGYDLGIGGGEMGTGLRPPSPCLSLPTRIGIAASITSSPTTTTSPTSPLGGEFGVRAVRSKASINGSGSTTPKSHSPVLVIGTEAVSLSPILPIVPQQQQPQPAKLQLNTSPSTTTTSILTTTEKYVSAPASATASATSPTSAASEVSAVSALSAVSGMGTADLDSFALGSPISPISPVSPVSPLSLDDTVEVKRAGSVRAEMMPF